MKSIKEVAELTGLSKQAVFNNCKVLGIEPIKVKNKSHITDEDYIKLIDRIVSNHQTTETTIELVHDENLDEVKAKSLIDKVIKENEQYYQDDSKHFVNVVNTNKRSEINTYDSESKEIIKDLKNELSMREKELDKFKEVEELLKNQIDDLKNDKAIMIEEKKELSRLLDQQQRLAIDHNNKIKTLESELIKKDEVIENIKEVKSTDSIEDKSIEINREVAEELPVIKKESGMIKNAVKIISYIFKNK